MAAVLASTTDDFLTESNFTSRAQLPEQVPKGSRLIPCTFMMSVEGMGSGLGTAMRMSVPGKDLYGQVAYLDSQKTTNTATEYLFRVSTYSHVERRMLTVASALLPSESTECVREFAYHLKGVCAKGYEGDENFASIEPFVFSSFRNCGDGAGGIRKGWMESFPVTPDGRNSWIGCEYHYRESERNMEKKFQEQWMVEDHRALMNGVLVTKGEEHEEAKERLKVSFLKEGIHKCEKGLP